MNDPFLQFVDTRNKVCFNKSLLERAYPTRELLFEFYSETFNKLNSYNSKGFVTPETYLPIIDPLTSLLTKGMKAEQTQGSTSTRSRY